MARMQVTFSNVTQLSVRAGSSNNISTLIFQITYRGKHYDCVGHLRSTSQSEQDDGSSHSRLRFSGYYGYNGPIDIQKLRDAAIDYYKTITGHYDDNLQLDRPDSGEHPGVVPPAASQTSHINKSYEFNVGGYDTQSSQKPN